MSDSPRSDLRLPALAVCAWASAVATTVVPAEGRMALVAVALIGGLVVVRRSSPGAARRTAAALAVLGIAVVIDVLLRGAVVHESWVAAMAKERASARMVVEIRSDPKIQAGREEDRATVRASVASIEARGMRSTARVSVVLALAASDASDLRVGATYAVAVRLAPSLFPDSAATVVVGGRPVLLREPGWSDVVAGHLRDAIQRASAGQTRAAGLVPALVDGDERSLPSGVQADFQAAGLSHLLAVSGTNFVLLGSAWIAVARWCGVRGRGLVPVGMAGILALVVLARAEPSVVRAAVMGGVALLGLGQGGSRQGIRALSACVCLVMLFVPALALSPGFALSALATGGILLFAGTWRDALTRWMPRVLAEAVAVTLAAYVACLPLVVALSGRLSLVAVPANLGAGLVVGPATVLGFLGGAAGLVLPAVGRIIAAPATWCASWIVKVAHTAAGLPHPDVGVGAGTFLLVVLVLVSIAVALSLGWLLRRPMIAAPILLVSMVATVVTIPGGSWPPAGWVLVACDVGQGDGLVVRLGEHRAMVVDTGPEPTAMRSCLRDLQIKKVPLLVLTHFHADHVNGLSAVIDTTEVGLIEATDLADPPQRADFVTRLAATAHVAVRRPQPGEQGADGDARWQVLAPLGPAPDSAESAANDASLVLLLEVRGIRILLMGDEETSAQQRLHASYPGLKVDVLKVSHHGSAKQDPELVSSLGARHAIISVGKGNDYGHPKASALALLRRAGMQVHRTDTDGAVAVVVDPSGALRVVARG
ncbi:MAG: ComEC/Rec2 family competence protein [Marmoricola sp.]